MRSISYILFFALTGFISCSPDSMEPHVINEVEGLVKVKTLESDVHLVELYTETGYLEEGYNELFLRIRNKGEATFLKELHLEWMPVMHMEAMQHSAPYSNPTQVPGKESLYSGFLIFQMAGSAAESWSLRLDYRVDGEEFSLTEDLEVLPSPRKRVTVFSGSDGENYVLALVAPAQPEVASNELKMALYRREGMLDYALAEGFTVKIDPRMPAMGNHSSPNNVDLVQGQGERFYTGVLNLTMTGFWQLHLQLLNQAGEVIKGEPVTESRGSSLFLELEF